MKLRDENSDRSALQHDVVCGSFEDGEDAMRRRRGRMNGHRHVFGLVINRDSRVVVEQIPARQRQDLLMCDPKPFLRLDHIHAREGQERRKHVDRGRHPRELVAKHRALTVESLRQVEDEGDLDGAFVAAVATAPEPVVADEIAGGGGEENERVGRIAPQNFLEQFAQKIVQFGDLGVVVFAEGGIGRSHLGTIIAIVFLHAWRVLIGRRGRCEGRLEGCRRRRIERRGARVVILRAQSMQIRAGERPRESQRPIFLLQNREIGPGPVDRR